MLGNVATQSILLDQCPDSFWKLCPDRFTEKSEHQIRKYKNPRKLALRNFIKVVGNLQLHEVTRSHILSFRHWLMEKIARSQLTGNSANKQLTHVKDVLHTVGLDHQIETDFKLLFAETKLQQQTNTRPSFEASYVQDTLIDAIPFQGLNHDARMLVYMMMDTGARESELIGLEKVDFFLDDAVPHIWIRKNVIRGLKTKSSDRKIPLVGISLWAAQQIQVTGFTRYQNNPDLASNTINKFLRENDLRPTNRHSLYSLRHTFKDRLRDAGAPEEIIHELMGHAKRGPQYGRGHLLETKYKWLQKIAYSVPQKAL